MHHDSTDIKTTIYSFCQLQRAHEYNIYCATQFVGWNRVSMVGLEKSGAFFLGA